MRYDCIEGLAPWCALNRIFGFAPKIGMELIRRLGSPEAVFRANRSELALLLNPESVYYQSITSACLKDAESELLRLERDGSSFLCRADERYPRILSECDDAPIGLYIKSQTGLEELFKPRPSVAIVGTRDITSYGSEWCIKIVNALARAKVSPVIVSGLAIGTDVTAHIRALELGIPTLAVMATGIETVYPFRHGAVAEKICNSDGCALITDYPPGTSPLAINFLRRNRIIAGLSKAVILIESKKKGGGLMTCRLAYSYNRDVYALPGRIDDVCSEGCNRLIREKIAEPISDMDALVSSLGLAVTSPDAKKDIKSYVLSKYADDESYDDAVKLSEIAEIISCNRDIRKNELCSLTGLPFQEIARFVSKLECDGIICTDLVQGCHINPNIL